MPNNRSQSTFTFRDYSDTPSSSVTSSAVAVSTGKGKSRATTPDLTWSPPLATFFDDVTTASKNSSVSEYRQLSKGRSRESDTGQRKKAKDSIVWMYFSKTPIGEGVFSVVEYAARNTRTAEAVEALQCFVT